MQGVLETVLTAKLYGECEDHMSVWRFGKK